MTLDAKIPLGEISRKWSNYKAQCKLVSPANKKKKTVIVVGSGLAGGGAASTLAEQGYKVLNFCFQDSPRRAHSIAAQGGVNACKNYQNDGDSVFRMFFDTIKGGDYRSREANTYRLAECSLKLIDHAVAQGVPFAREYSGYLDNRSFGGVQVKRTFYARGQTGQQLLLGTYSALSRQVSLGKVDMYSRHEMLNLVLVNGKAKGIIARDLVTGEILRFTADAVVLATGGYGKIYYWSTLAMGCNGSAIWRAYKKGALMANPSFVQVHPTSLPQSGEHQSKLTLMSESLRNDGRIWVPLKKNDKRSPNEIPEGERDYYLERIYPQFGNLTPRDIASRAAKERIDAGYGVGNAVYLDFKDAIKSLGKAVIEQRYGNLFDMYQKITGVNAYKEPMKISPAAHFTMGGLWVDYELMTTIPGLFAIGEANFSDHGANRLGANSLLQASVDGNFILPYTISNYLSRESESESVNAPEFENAEKEVKNQLLKLLNINGSRTVDSYHKELGKLLYDSCGVLREKKKLTQAIDEIKNLRKSFWENVKVPGSASSMNSEIEKATRVADYLELAELMCLDALTREESCGAHFREEYKTRDGEAMRNDKDFSFVSAWKFNAEGLPQLYKEPLSFSAVQPALRTYR